MNQLDPKDRKTPSFSRKKGKRDPSSANEPRFSAKEPASERETPRPQPDDRDKNGDGQNERVEPLLVHENRDERTQVRVRVPFELLLEGGRLQGRDISIGGLASASTTGLRVGDVSKGAVSIRFSGFRATIPMTLRMLENDRQKDVARFEIADIDEAELAILRRIIRAYLAGQQLTIEQLARHEDPQTVRKRVAKDAVKSEPKRNWIRFGVVAAVLLVILVGLGAALYEKLFLVQPSFAAVTAPKVDIRAPTDGKLSSHNLHAGDRVKRGQPLLDVVDPEINAELALAKATLAYNERMVENLRESIKNTDDSSITVVSGGDSSSPMPSLMEMSPLEARARIEEFESTAEFAAAKIDSLQTRAAKGQIYSPCDCLITWIRSEAGGYWVQKGDRIAELIEADARDVTVEALVHLDNIGKLAANQKAYVELPTTHEIVEARVDAVQLESERMQRAGFPKWARQDMSHGSVILSIEDSIPPQMVGQPVKVSFVDAEGMGLRTVANLFKSIRDTVEPAWNAVAEEIDGETIDGETEAAMNTGQ